MLYVNQLEKIRLMLSNEPLLGTYKIYATDLNVLVTDRICYMNYDALEGRSSVFEILGIRLP